MNFSSFLNPKYYLTPEADFGFWYVFVIFFSLLIILSFLVRIVLKRNKYHLALESFYKQFFWFYLIVGVVGLFGVEIRYEKLPIFSARIFLYSLLLIFLGLNVWLVYYYYTDSKKKIIKVKNKLRKEKWLK